MRKIIKISLILSIIISTSCKEKNNSVNVESLKVDNFSNINYKEATNHPYFSEVKFLPIGFSLGDFKDSGSILYLTESANIFPFDDENLKYFLTDEEQKTAHEIYVDSSFTEPINRKVQYYPYERLITKNYVLLFINKRVNKSKGRNYQYDVRTYTFDGELISNHSLAKWDDDNEIYFGGWIMPDMIIKREFDNGKIEYFKIAENGKIIKIDADKS